MNAIKVHNIEKSYGKVKALQNISFEVASGELFGFIGPDGAGKTTLFRILTTLLLPDNGHAEVAGHDVADYKQIRNIVGYMPGRFSLYHDLTVEENLNFFATIFGTSVEENYDLIREIYVQIEPFKKRKAGALSGGMKQKLALSCALIHKPKVLFLDEPTTGVDPVSRKEFWEMLKRLKEKDITILVSTPYMDEASLCDRVALIQNGRILQIDTPEAIVKGHEKPILAIKATEVYRLINDIRDYKYTNSIYPFGEYLHYTDQRSDYNIAELKEYLERKGHEHITIAPIEGNIEDSFMALMKDHG